jgi:redox-sensitive bicupin YhaK (pirin superfamily)
MQTTDAIELRPGSQRGTFANSWLSARFSFSFGSYHEPGREGFGPLRALNEDVVQPGTGFDMHPHRDLDIFILPLSGVVEHRDSLGNHAHVKPGQVQKMHAGSGIEHSQMNASPSSLDHHLQIWLTPRLVGGTPSVEARSFDLFDRPGRWCDVISPDGRGGSFAIDQDALLATTRVLPGKPATWRPRDSSMLYLHAIDGSAEARVGETRTFQLATGDALAIACTTGHALNVHSLEQPSRFLIFEFACDRT